MLLSLTILLLRLTTVASQFPRDCMTKEALDTKQCCPPWNGSMCGKDFGRGSCEDNVGENEPQEKYRRLKWPLGYYNRSCVCNDFYDGYNCGDCDYGRHGSLCENQTMVIRPEIRELSPQERLAFFSALQLAKYTMSDWCVIPTVVDMVNNESNGEQRNGFVNASVYDCVVATHSFTTVLVMVNDSWTNHDLIHGSCNFLTWHRWMILELEREMQKLTQNWNLSIPYWDWRKDNVCKICEDEYLGKSDPNGTISPLSYFYSWEVVCFGSNNTNFCSPKDECQKEHIIRHLGEGEKSLPTEEDVNNTLKFKVYDLWPFNSSSNGSLRNVLEGFAWPSSGKRAVNDSGDGEQLFTMHNQVHRYMGGTLRNVSFSANDFIFFLHHCMIDKIFQAWIMLHNATMDDYPACDVLGQGPNDFIVPALPRVMNKEFMKSSTNFGYMYSDYQDFKPMDTAMPGPGEGVGQQVVT